VCECVRARVCEGARACRCAYERAIACMGVRYPGAHRSGLLLLQTITCVGRKGEKIRGRGWTSSRLVGNQAASNSGFRSNNNGTSARGEVAVVALLPATLALVPCSARANNFFCLLTKPFAIKSPKQSLKCSACDGTLVGALVNSISENQIMLSSLEIIELCCCREPYLTLPIATGCLESRAWPYLSGGPGW